MKKIASILLALVLCLSMSAALAQTEAEFNQGCWVKTAGSTELYTQSDDSGVVVGTTTDLPSNFKEVGRLPGGTYLQIIATVGNYDLVSFWGGSGYVKSSAITSATTTIQMDDGTSVEVAEALAKDNSALLSYLSKTYPGKKFSSVSGSSVVHVGSASTGVKSAKPAVSTLPVPAVYFTDEFGSKHEVQLIQLATGYSIINNGGRQVTVPTTTLSWETEAKKNKVLALVNASKTGSAPLLAEASKKADVLTELTTGTVVAVIKSGSNYSRVYADGQVGFVKTSNLKFQGNKEIKGLQTGYLAYNDNLNSNNEINVRSASKKGARIVGTYPSGTPISILNKGKTWSEIEVGSLHCFVLTEYVTAGHAPKTQDDMTEGTIVQTSGNTATETVEAAAAPAPVVTAAPKKTPADTKNQKIYVGDELTIGYGSYAMDNNYHYADGYEDDDRFFFDEEF